MSCGGRPTVVSTVALLAGVNVPFANCQRKMALA